jgi:hypothetical protein
MALTAAQRSQLAGVPVIDAAVDSSDALALARLSDVETLPTELSLTQLKQLAGVPIVDATVTSDDSRSFIRLPESGNTGPFTIGFSLSWYIDPTFGIDYQEALDIDGALDFGLRSFGFGLSGVTIGGSTTAAAALYITASHPVLRFSMAEEQATDSLAQLIIQVSSPYLHFILTEGRTDDN